MHEEPSRRLHAVHTRLRARSRAFVRFAQGDYALVERDLQAAFPRDLAEAISSCIQVGRSFVSGFRLHFEGLLALQPRLKRGVLPGFY